MKRWALPGRGAPANAVLPKLQPLNENTDTGIAHFSGVATYAKDFAAPKGWKAGQPLWLNLGDLREVAQVSVNGKDVGMLTQLGKTNSGLFDGDPDALWSSLDEHIRRVMFEHADGRFEARPVMGAKECSGCRARLVCGQARREWVLDATAADSAEEGASE